MNNNPMALAGLRVVDFTEALAGPVCGMILGDLGADVIKVERPGRGDQSRGYGPPFAQGESAYFMSVNRNKRSLTLDITTEAGQAIMQRLLPTADVFLLNMPRQSSWRKYGLDYETLAENDPRLIMVAISGYGHTGPKAGAPGYDVIAQGEAGGMSLTGEPGRPPVRFPTPMADMSAGLYATIGVLSSLQARHHTGQGQFLDISLLESQVSWLLNLAAAYHLSGQPPQRLGNSHPMLVPYGVYHARDRAFNLGVATEPLWQHFCQVLERPELAADPRFATNAGRVGHRAILEPILDEIFAQRDAAEWLARLEAARVPCGPINTLPEVLADDHFQARGGVVEVAHPLLGTVALLANPIHASQTSPTYRLHPPLLGEHNQEILTEMGYTPAEIEAMRSAGAI